MNVRGGRNVVAYKNVMDSLQEPYAHIPMGLNAIAVTDLTSSEVGRFAFIAKTLHGSRSH